MILRGDNNPDTLGSNGKGGFTFDTNSNKSDEDQINEFAELLINKIHQIRVEENV